VPIVPTAAAPPAHWTVAVPAIGFEPIKKILPVIPVADLPFGQAVDDAFDVGVPPSTPSPGAAIAVEVTPNTPTIPRIAAVLAHLALILLLLLLLTELPSRIASIGNLASLRGLSRTRSRGLLREPSHARQGSRAI
jgi:hypothetical protein